MLPEKQHRPKQNESYWVLCTNPATRSSTSTVIWREEENKFTVSQTELEKTGGVGETSVVSLGNGKGLVASQEVKSRASEGGQP